jgi:hypothetical protein
MIQLWGHQRASYLGGHKLSKEAEVEFKDSTLALVEQLTVEHEMVGICVCTVACPVDAVAKEASRRGVEAAKQYLADHMNEIAKEIEKTQAAEFARRQYDN